MQDFEKLSPKKIFFKFPDLTPPRAEARELRLFYSISMQPSTNVSINVQFRSKTFFIRDNLQEFSKKIKFGIFEHYEKAR